MGAGTSSCISDDTVVAHSTMQMLTFRPLPLSFSHSPVPIPRAEKTASLSVSSTADSVISASSISDSDSDSGPSSRKVASKPPLHRSNSLSSVHVKDCVSLPNNSTIEKVASHFHDLLTSHENLPVGDGRLFSEFEPTARQVFSLMRKGDLKSASREYTAHPMPSRATVTDFLTHLAKRSQLEKGCAVVALVYVNRLIAKCQLRLTSLNWRHVLFASVMMASKVYDDVSMWNVDFASVSQFFVLDQANSMEVLMLNLFEWNMMITPAEYAYTFLHLFDGHILEEELDVVPQSPMITVQSLLSKNSPSASSHASASSLVLAPELSSDPFDDHPIPLQRMNSCGPEFVHLSLAQPMTVA